MSGFAHWLNTAWHEFDHAILEWCHELAANAGGFWTPVMKFISFLGTGGVLFIIVGLVLLLFRPTRRAGLATLLGLLCSLLMTNIAIKNIVARPRPYIDPASDYFTWWQYIDGTLHSEHSFPSGHTCSTMAAVFGLFAYLPLKRRYSWTVFFYVVLMGLSRNYLMMHYPTDIIGGVLVGAVAGLCGCGITALLYRAADRHPNAPAALLLTQRDIRQLRKNK